MLSHGQEVLPAVRKRDRPQSIQKVPRTACGGARFAREQRDPRSRGEIETCTKMLVARKRLQEKGIRNPTRGEIEDELLHIQREGKGVDTLALIHEVPDPVKVVRKIVWTFPDQAPSREKRKGAEA